MALRGQFCFPIRSQSSFLISGQSRCPIYSLSAIGSDRFSVSSRADTFNPRKVRLVPVDRFGQSLLEGNSLSPAQFRLGPHAVDGVPAVMAGAVRDMLDEGCRFTGELEHGFGHVDVVPLAAAAEVIDFPRASTVECCGNTAAVVADMDPVTNLHTIAVDRQGDVCQGIG